MKRRKFFKGMGLVGAAAYVNPLSLIKKPDQPRKGDKGMDIVDLDAKYPTMIYDLHSPELIKAAKDWENSPYGPIDLEEEHGSPIAEKDFAGRLLQQFFGDLDRNIEVMYLLMGGIRFIDRKTLRKPKWDNKKGWLSDNWHFQPGARYLEFTPALESLISTICNSYGIFYEGGDDEDYLSSFPSEGLSFIYSHQELAKPTNRFFTFNSHSWTEM